MVYTTVTTAHSINIPDPLQWRHNGRDSVSNHQPRGCFLNRLFRHRSKKTSKLRVAGLCAGNSPEAGEFPAQMASNAENVSIWWRHHAIDENTRYQSTPQVFTNFILAQSLKSIWHIENRHLLRWTHTVNIDVAMVKAHGGFHYRIWKVIVLLYVKGNSHRTFMLRLRINI